MEAKEAAQTLFNEGWPQKDIAATLKRSEKTISQWAKQGNWDAKRTEKQLFRQTASEQVQSLITYQLKVLNRIREKMEDDFNPEAEIEDLQKMLIDKGDIDALQKLFHTVKGKELEWTQMVRIVRDFMQHLEHEATDLAKKVVPYANEYLNDKRQKN